MEVKEDRLLLVSRSAAAAKFGRPECRTYRKGSYSDVDSAPLQPVIVQRTLTTEKKVSFAPEKSRRSSLLPLFESFACAFVTEDMDDISGLLVIVRFPQFTEGSKSLQYGKTDRNKRSRHYKVVEQRIYLCMFAIAVHKEIVLSSSWRSCLHYCDQLLDFWTVSNEESIGVAPLLSICLLDLTIAVYAVGMDACLC
jgi:hypothetical protein